MSQILTNSSIFNLSSLQAYWSFNASDSTDDKNANDGTDTAITYNTSNGRYLVGAGFNGTTSKISVGNNNQVNPTTTLTFVGWFKISSIAAINLLTGHTANNGSEWYIDTNGKQNLSKAGVAVIGTSTTATGTGAFYNLGVTFDGTNAIFYRNGISDGTGSSAQTFDTGLTRVWGNDNSTAFFGNNGGGAMDDVAIFNAVLTPSQMLTIYQDSSGFFSVL